MSDLPFQPLYSPAEPSYSPVQPSYTGAHAPPFWIQMAAMWAADFCGISTEEMLARYGVIPIESILNQLFREGHNCREAARELCGILRGDEDEDFAEDEEEQDWEEQEQEDEQVLQEQEQEQFGKRTSKKLKKQAKRLKIRLTVTRNGKRFPKSNKVLRKQIKEKLKSF